MRGTKLLAWRIPPPMTKDYNAVPVEGSTLNDAQRRLAEATRKALAAVAADVRAGLAETVGVGATLNKGERTSVVLDLPALPEEINSEYIANSIDVENVEAWCDERGQVHVAIGPWYTTKDVDQVVLSITKVAHVLLGLHASDLQDEGAQSSLWRRLLTAATEIAALQKRYNRN